MTGVRVAAWAAVAVAVLGGCTLPPAGEGGQHAPSVQPTVAAPGGRGPASAAGRPDGGTGATPGAAPGAAPRGMRVLTTVYPSPAMGGTRRVLVLLPKNYGRRGVRYPVVELLHGHPGRPADLLSSVKGALQSYATAPGIAPFIGVVPDGNGPVVDDSWWADIPGQPIATAVTRDLRAWVSRSFKTNGSWSYAGLSTGGYGAAYLPLVDTQPVHAECGLSGYYDASQPPIPPSTTAAGRAAYSPSAHARQAPALVFLAYGDHDAAARQQAVAYADALRAAHHSVTVQVYPGAHRWSVWRPAFERCLRIAVPAGPRH